MNGNTNGKEQTEVIDENVEIQRLNRLLEKHREQDKERLNKIAIMEVSIGQLNEQLRKSWDESRPYQQKLSQALTEKTEMQGKLSEAIKRITHLEEKEKGNKRANNRLSRQNTTLRKEIAMLRADNEKVRRILRDSERPFD